uniref:Uncharacterized protein n=1 Tax=Trichuris muris TaxID=70415 RepID=A0A5S6Q5Y7_TRIMR
MYKYHGECFIRGCQCDEISAKILSNGSSPSCSLLRHMNSHRRFAWDHRDSTVCVTSSDRLCYDYNHLPANSPCDDQHADGYCRLNNSYYFGVFHGHAVLQCAKAVAGRLCDYLAVSILPENVLKEIYCGADFSSVDILETS